LTETLDLAQGIRRGSQRITPETAWDPYTLQNAFTDWAKIVDCGDVPMVSDRSAT